MSTFSNVYLCLPLGAPKLKMFESLNVIDAGAALQLLQQYVQSSSFIYVSPQTMTTPGTMRCTDGEGEMLPTMRRRDDGCGACALELHKVLPGVALAQDNRHSSKCRKESESFALRNIQSKQRQIHMMA